jgi:hypothetical protein
LPAILYVCGHSGRGRDGNKTAFQDHGFWFANNGYVCLVVDTLQLGEIPGVHHGTYGRPWGHLKAWGETDAEKMKNHNRFWWWSAGYTPAGVEAWNGIRGIDAPRRRSGQDRGHRHLRRRRGHVLGRRRRRARQGRRPRLRHE